MKGKPYILSALTFLCAINFQLSTVHAQGTVFTYQGHVTSNGTNFTGTGQFKFALVTGTNASSQATATAIRSGGFIVNYTVDYGGSGYAIAPVVTISGGGGSGATATANVSGGVVTSLTPVSAGAGYTSSPTVTIAAPAASITYTTYWSNDGTSSAGSQPASAVSVAVANGLFTVVLGDTTLANMTAISASLFAQPKLQLQIWFSDSVNGFALLSPLQNLTPTPYASFANIASNVNGAVSASQINGALGSANLTGTYGNQMTMNNAGNNFSGTFSGSGANLTLLNASQLASGTVPDAQLSANVALLNSSPSFSGTVTAASFKGAGVRPWLMVAGTTQSAQPNTGYLLTNDALVTVTLPASPNLGDILSISGTGASGWKIAQNTGQSVLTANLSATIGAVWTARDSSRDWFSVASSVDGTKLVAIVIGGKIYTSTDSGVSWTARESNRSWSSVASSTDGTKLVAVGQGTQIFTSIDSGVTWAPHYGNFSWYSVASSADGSKLVTVMFGGQIFTSADSGVTWTPRDSIRNWSSVASSTDGTKLVAVEDGGQIYTSTDSGVTWTPRDSIRNWASVASSSDGTKLVAVNYGGQIYTTADSGVTWTARDSSRNWQSVTSSSDGTKLVAGVNPGQIYTSTDSGVTWTPRDNSRNWRSVASSSDGTKLVAVSYGGQIYTSVPSSIPSTTTGTAGYLVGNQYSAIELQYIGNGRFVPISHEGLINAY